MGEFLHRPGSIVGPLLWGVLGAVATFVLIFVVDFVWSLYSEDFGPPHLVESIAVGGGYSISIRAQPAHLFLAEYEQEVSIYGGEPRLGDFLGSVRIPMNTGGRVRIGLLVPTDPTRHDVVLHDRDSTSRIDLVKQSVRPESGDLTAGGLRALGWFSGESYPLKFIPCAVWSRLDIEEQQAIARGGDVPDSFCDIGNAN